MTIYKTALVFDQDGKAIARIWELGKDTMEEKIAEILRHSKNCKVEYGTVNTADAIWDELPREEIRHP